MILKSGKDIIRRLESEGRAFVSSKGSHHKYRKNGQSLIVPHPKKDLPIGIARSVARAAGRLKETL